MSTFIKLFNLALESTVVIEVSESRSEMFREASTKGVEMGRTSFVNLITGKSTMVCGWVIEAEQTFEEVINDAAAQLQQLQDAVGSELKIKSSKTEDYATLRTAEGRLQFNPKKDGSFSIMFFSNKTQSPTTLGMEVVERMNQYVRLAPLTTKQITEALASSK